MKERYLITSILLLIAFTNGFSQLKEYVAKDGTRVFVEILSNENDSVSKLGFSIGKASPASALYLGVDYFNPKLFYTKALASKNIQNFEFTYIPFNRSVDSKTGKSVSQSYHTKYWVKIPDKEKRSYGINAGINILDHCGDQTIFYEDNYSKLEHSYVSLLLGLSRIKTKHIKWYIKNSAGKGTLSGEYLKRINLNMVYYIKDNVKYIVREEEKQVTLNNNLALRLSLDGRLSVWGTPKGQLTINYVFGIQTGVKDVYETGISNTNLGIREKINNRTNAIMSLGVGYNIF